MLEGTSGALWSKLPLKAGSATKSDEVTQFIQPTLEKSKGWRLHSSLGKLATAWLFQWWKFLLTSILNLPHFNICKLPLVLPPCATVKSLAPSPRGPACNRSGLWLGPPWSHSLKGWTSLGLSVSPQRESAPALTVLVDIWQTCLNLSTPSSCWKEHGVQQALRRGR